MESLPHELHGGSANNGVVDYVKVTVPTVFAVDEGIKEVSVRPLEVSVTEGVEMTVFTLTTGTGYTEDAGMASATVSVRE